MCANELHEEIGEGLLKSILFVESVLGIRIIILVLAVHETHLAIIVYWASVLENFFSDVCMFLMHRNLKLSFYEHDLQIYFFNT